VVGNFPIAALTAFPGSGLDEGIVDELLRQLRERRATETPAGESSTCRA
jgi:hypothetical protein